MSDDDTEWERGDAISYFEEAEFWDAIFEPIYATMGYTGFGMMAGTVIVLSLYSWTGTLLMPAIVLALFGGTMILAAPPAAAYIGTIMVAVAVATAFYTIYREP